MAYLAYYVVPIVFASCLAFTLGLTYLPCYSAICVEEFYPYETRVHIATFYALVSSIALTLSARALTSYGRKLSEYHLTIKPLPILQKRITLGGIVLAIWVTGIVLSTTGFWWQAQFDYYETRGKAVDYTIGTIRLAVVGISGHWCDLLASIVILPISRGSILGRFFQLQTSTLLYAHKLIAYGFFVAVLVHMITLYSWVPAFALAPSEDQKAAFYIDNPLYTIPEVEAKGYYYYTPLASGGVATVALIVIVITSLPKLRRASYNTFYYSHFICSCIIFVLISIHASTDFYFILPGILLWLFDWALRLRWLLRPDIRAQISSIGSDWFQVTLPVSCEKGLSSVSQINPLQTYYINFPSVSRTQCHAFTASSISSTDAGPTFVFRKCQGKSEKKLNKEWTWKLAALAETNSDPESRSVDIRLEGPYTPPVPELFFATDILCVVGGTGITGALSIANWWLASCDRCESGTFRLVWTVRGDDVSQLRQIEELQERTKSMLNFTIVIHVSGSSNGRLNVSQAVQNFVLPADQPLEKTTMPTGGEKRRAWVYASGPGGLLDAAETVCLRCARDLKYRDHPEVGGRNSFYRLNWYSAKWEV